MPGVCGRFGPGARTPELGCSPHDSAHSGHSKGGYPAPVRDLAKLSLSTSSKKSAMPYSMSSAASPGGLYPASHRSDELQLSPSPRLAVSKPAQPNPVARLASEAAQVAGSAPTPITPRRPPPHRSPRHDSASKGLEDLPGFGSWAQRQFHFQQTSPPAQPAHSRTAPRSKARASRRNSESEDEESARQAAWRWRFNRRCLPALAGCGTALQAEHRDCRQSKTVSYLSENV